MLPGPHVHPVQPHGVSELFFDDYTDRMPGYIEQWKKLGFSFDGIMTGFLGSREQIEIVTDFIRYFKRENTVVLVDPIMGDHGEAYATYTPQMCEEMKELVQYAGIVTPNVTEACLLTETVYSENFSRRALTDLSYKILLMGPRAVIITGIVRENRILNLVHEQGKEPVFLSTRRVGHERPGTGGHLRVGGGRVGGPRADNRGGLPESRNLREKMHPALGGAGDPHSGRRVLRGMSVVSDAIGFGAFILWKYVV